MTKPGSLLLTGEMMIVIVMSLAASYSLLGSSPFFFVPFIALLSLGTLTVVAFPLGSFAFNGGCLLAILPLLMKLNTVKWWFLSPDRLAFCPTLGVPAALAVGLLVVSGGLLLGYLQPLRRELRTLLRDDVRHARRSYASAQALNAVAGTLLSAAVAGGVTVVVTVVQGRIAGWVGGMAWSIPLGAAVLFIILALTLFWIGGVSARRNSNQ